MVFSLPHYERQGGQGRYFKIVFANRPHSSHLRSLGVAGWNITSGAFMGISLS